MPAPDPWGVEPGDRWPRHVLVYEWPCGNIRHRHERARRIMQNAVSGDWTCRECGGPVPFSRRADAVYCRASCRKRAARKRKAHLATLDAG